MNPMSTLYLAHPYLDKEKIREWELKMEAKYPQWDLLNPFFDLPQPEPEGPEEIVNRDLAAIKGAAGIIAVLTESQSYGVAMEIVYATLLRKPVLLIVTNGQAGHPWLRYHAKVIYTSLNQFENDFFKKHKE